MNSRTLDLDVPVHYIEQSGPGAHTVVLVHGLGGSHLNFLPIIPLLAKRATVLALDLAGFGRTPRGGLPASIPRNLALLTAFLRARTHGPVTLVGNSMGGLLSLLAAASEPARVRDLVLLDPALPMAPGAALDPAVLATFGFMLIPGLGARLMKNRKRTHGAEAMTRDFMRLCSPDPSRIDPGVMAAHVELAREREGLPWAEQVFVEASRSLLATLTRRGGFYAQSSAVRCPVMLVHGAHDRLISVVSARAMAKRHPAWKYLENSDLGHIPQLEDPAWLVEEIHRWSAARDDVGSPAHEQT